MTDQASAAEISKTALVPMRSVRQQTTNDRPRKSNKGRLANGVALERIAATGLERILDRIVKGELLTDIADDIKVSMSALAMYLTGDESREAYTRARMLSADAWLEKGYRFLLDASDSSAAVNKARALELSCYRQAAIRNPRYSERNQVELSGPDGGPIQSQVQIAVYLPQNHRVVLDK